ncbi:hypothetical protein PsorP6_013074 [Peronosclerospora sorghi]|uniref:Uncharacterized protein n=1 Tax=Peronosclerospora sorghi TaxID=230839 RepID=A0ACC0WIY7_9STRA|nr:hypothetical protein PsorP6_013074 [Peronosclerospora sorghi]
MTCKDVEEQLCIIPVDGSTEAVSPQRRRLLRQQLNEFLVSATDDKTDRNDRYTLREIEDETVDDPSDAPDEAVADVDMDKVAETDLSHLNEDGMDDDIFSIDPLSNFPSTI